ncbi:alanine--tRNA ligase [Candidatus Sumerlaeota bacterium]|nr:alanine--tRNA ligase [Candidatus Sumerlaeota bacterium]
MTTSRELRQMFLDYFVERDHTLVASSPIVPPDDPTMLFTSAGMVQFKPLWGGTVEPLPYRRATSCQKCMRAGGKGSDLENVGKTLRHHTFFEMLGNFSFGDYFKVEALEWGWDFVWNKMKLPKERLWGTVFEDDPEAAEILEKEIGLPRDRIVPLDAKENFWGPAGDTGACGPCSEIIFFTGTEEQLKEATSQAPATIARRIVEEGDLFFEIWNMVFPQFDQQLDGSRPPLKYRGIDTGAGLERMTTAMQFIESEGKVRSPYETDLLLPITRATAEIVGKPYDTRAGAGDPEKQDYRFWINAITDHARALTFALSEGIVPSNEGRGYVLRRILRRALRFAYLMEKEEPFLYRLVGPVVDAMGDVYPEVRSQPEHVAHVIKLEEERFLRTVAQGTRILDEKIAQAKNDDRSILSGDDAFLLHATYGFPLDMTAEIAEDAGLALDREGYERAMKQHQEEARKSWKGAALGEEAELLDDVYESQGETEFVGYDEMECESRVVAIVCAGRRIDQATAGDEATVVLEITPFYAESGGQVGDRGVLESADAKFEVADTQKTPSGIVLHKGKVASGSIRVGDALTARVDRERRMATMRNHTVTHLLQAALKRVVGKHITQSGSWVGPESMRFDFSHTQAVSAAELREVERIVNAHILGDCPVSKEEMPIEAARQRGAIAPFGEKYGHVVRVVTVGDLASPVSMEFCGGTHLDRVGVIGSFRILSESSVAAGIRRIEGATGMGAYERWASTRDTAAEVCRALAIKEEQLAERIGAMQDEAKKLGREIKRLKTARPASSVDDLAKGAVDADGLKIVAAKIDDADPDQLRALADQIRDKLADGCVCVLGSTDGKKVSLLCAVTKNATSRIKAGDVIKQIAPIVGGGGGGRPDLAQAGGKNPEKLDEAIAKAPEIVQAMLKA